MPNARLIILVAGASAVIGACSKQTTPDQNVLIDTTIPANAEIEALPPDESSGTPPGDVANAEGNAAIDEPGNSNGNSD